MKATNAVFFKGIAMSFSFAVIFCLTMVSDASAQKTLAPSASPMTSLVYTGTVDNHMNFLMKYDNESSEKFILSITDAEGRTIFEDVYAERRFSKTFSVPVDFGNVTFTISSYRNRAEKKYQVSTERRVIEEVIIKKP
jgi:hypothetical protein